MLVLIGYDHYVEKNQIVAVLSPLSSPVKKLKRDAEEKGTLLDATNGRKTLSLVVMKTHVVLTALQPETLARRLNKLSIAEKVPIQESSRDPDSEKIKY